MVPQHAPVLRGQGQGCSYCCAFAGLYSRRHLPYVLQQGHVAPVAGSTMQAGMRG